MPVSDIDTLDDPRLDPYRNLRLTNKTRWSGQFICEGHRVVRRLIDSPLAIDSIVVSRQRRERFETAVPDDVPLYVVSQTLATELVGYNFHHGVAACGIRPTQPKLHELIPRIPQPALIVACPHISDPDNLGGLIRLSAGFGVGALLLGESCCDPYSRRVLRVSMGAAFEVPILECRNLAAKLNRLRDQHGFRLIASVLDAGATVLANVSTGAPTVVLLGNEAEGLPRQWIEMSDARVTIPMAAADSLNVTVAAGILLHWLRFGQERN